MRNRKIKYWKVVADNLDIKTAVRMLKAQAVHGRQYEYLAIRLKYKIFEPGTNMENVEMPISETLSENWEAMLINKMGEFNCIIKEIKVTYEEEEV